MCSNLGHNGAGRNGTVNNGTGNNGTDNNGRESRCVAIPYVVFSPILLTSNHSLTHSPRLQYVRKATIIIYLHVREIDR